MPSKPLSVEEEIQLVNFLNRLTWPISKEVFHAWVGKFVTVPIELLVFNLSGKVLLVPRDDPEYPDCYHLPGTVLRDNETVQDALARLIEDEIGVCVSVPDSKGWFEFTRGPSLDQNPTRHEISLPFVCQWMGPMPEKGKFFSLDKLPKNLLDHHKILILKVIPRIFL